MYFGILGHIAQHFLIGLQGGIRLPRVVEQPGVEKKPHIVIRIKLESTFQHLSGLRGISHVVLKNSRFTQDQPLVQA